MQADEFWCRAFLAAMQGAYTEHADGGRWGNHRTPAVYCEAAADAALEVARRRGMVTGERTASGAPELVRVEFTAERGDHGLWHLSGPDLGAGLTVASEATGSKLSSGATVRIAWAETMPPKPAEVWIERPAKGGA